LAFGFAAFFSAAGFFAAVFFGVLAFLGLAAFGFTAFFGLAAGFFLGLKTVEFSLLAFATNSPFKGYPNSSKRI
jgi:hypothetical protein